MLFSWVSISSMVHASQFTPNLDILYLLCLLQPTCVPKPFQVQQELSSTFARLCHLVDETTSEMKDDIKRIDVELAALKENADRSKVSTFAKDVTFLLLLR